jgi:hypothetical protein
VAKKINLKPSKILFVVFFPILAILSLGFVLFLRPFSKAANDKTEKQ